MQLPSLDIVIVNWNTGPQLWECVLSIAQSQQIHFQLGQVIVVDNASTDDSLRPLAAIHMPLQIVRNRTNRGFAVACNQGASHGNAEYLLFLNPDIRLEPEALDSTVQWMQKSPTTGICGIQLVDDGGEISISCSRLPSAKLLAYGILGLNSLFPHIFPGQVMSEWDHRESRTVEQVMGAYFLIRRPVFSQLNGFDERFFVYFEEVDLSWRVLAAGWTSYYLATARAYHKGGGASEQVKARRLFYYWRSRILFGYKYYPYSVATLLAVLTFLVEPLARIAQALITRRPTAVRDIVHAQQMLVQSLFAGWV